MFWSKTLILFVTLFTGYASAKRIPRIFGGSDVQIKDYPYQVSLRLRGQHFCGGAVISERHILTAAHCIIDDMKPPFSEFHVAMGTSYRNEPVDIIHRIAKVDVHPGWLNDEDESYPNDIAVITLNDKIIFDENQQKVRLPSHDYEDGRIANFTGWGIAQEDSEIFRPDQLQMIHTKLVSQDKCPQRMMDSEGTKILDTQVCAFALNKESGFCLGDSGGPLVVDGEVVGVASWYDGDSCALGSPDVYTNVYKYSKDFIEKILKDSK